MMQTNHVGRANKGRKAVARGLLALSASAGLISAAQIADASTFYWDADGASAVGNPPTAGVGGAGSWDNSGLKWWDGATYQSWTATGGQDVADAGSWVPLMRPPPMAKACDGGRRG